MTKVLISNADQDVTIIASGSNTLAPAIDTAQRGNVRQAGGGTVAVNDEFKFTRYFPKSGTYRVKYRYVISNNQGIWDISLDGNTDDIFTAIDQYSAGTTNNQELFTTKEIPRGSHDIHWNTPSKNASSSAFNILFNALEFELIDEHPVLGEASASPRNGMELLGYKKLDASATSLSVSFKPKKILNIRFVKTGQSTSQHCQFRVGTGGSIDTGNNYARRHSNDGTTDIVANTQGFMYLNVALSDLPLFVEINILNILDQEKLFLYHSVGDGSVGAGTSPQRKEVVAKWDDLTGQIDIIEMYANSGTLDAGSFVEVWGMD